VVLVPVHRPGGSNNYHSLGYSNIWEVPVLLRVPAAARLSFPFFISYLKDL
jgi:hypothetical protein